MKTCVIADVHGRDQWKQIVAQEQDADMFIFLGDYFDSFDIPGTTQLQNFLDIVAFKESGEKQVVMLIGNHDVHYFPHSEDSATSGYQAIMAPTYKYAIDQHKHNMQIAFKLGEFVFSHAGISSEWMDDNFVGWNVDNMVDYINGLFKYKPNSLEYKSFKYYNYGDENERAILSHGYGDEPYQGPLWIRPKALMAANRDTLRKEIIQVVGHTHQTQIDKKGGATGGRYYFTDVQETSEEYMIIIDGNITFNNTKQKQQL